MLTYINDINLNLGIPIYIFSDDITLKCQLKNVQDQEEILKSCVSGLKYGEWSLVLLISIKCVMFSNIKINQMSTIKLGGEILEFTEKNKLLRIILSKKMSWDNCIVYIYSSANKFADPLQKLPF